MPTEVGHANCYIFRLLLSTAKNYSGSEGWDRGWGGNIRTNESWFLQSVSRANILLAVHESTFPRVYLWPLLSLFSKAVFLFLAHVGFLQKEFSPCCSRDSVSSRQPSVILKLNKELLCWVGIGLAAVQSSFRPCFHLKVSANKKLHDVPIPWFLSYGLNVVIERVWILFFKNIFLMLRQK